MTTHQPEESPEPTPPTSSGWAKVRALFVKKAGAGAVPPEEKKHKAPHPATPPEPTQATLLMASASAPLPDKPGAWKSPESPAPVANIEVRSSTSGTPSPAPLPIVVRFSNVTKMFGPGATARAALSDISFTIEDLPDTGELISIVGPSGCGKSTLLRMIAGLQPHYPQTTGEIEILGQKGNLLPSSDRGLVDQKYSLFPHLTVRQNIMFGLDIRGEGRSTRGDKADIWIKKVGLEGAENKYPQELSGGMQQRVAIASTLVLGPRILLMDEPFGALDPKIRLKMQELLVQLWNEQQSTVFIVTHSVEEAVYLGDRVFRMAAQPGRLMEILQAPRPDMPPEEMRQKKWFVEMTRDLLNRLEQDKLAAGELASYPEFVKEHNLRHPKTQR